MVGDAWSVFVRPVERDAVGPRSEVGGGCGGFDLSTLVDGHDAGECLAETVDALRDVGRVELPTGDGGLSGEFGVE